MILELQKNGLKQQQIIDALKQTYGMPFDIEKSLFSRHFKKLTAETQTEKDHQHEEQNLEKLKQYCKYLEQSNQQLINTAQAQHQTDRSHFKQQQQLHKQLTEKQETLNILQNQLETKQIEAEKQHKTILKLEMRIVCFRLLMSFVVLHVLDIRCSFLISGWFCAVFPLRSA